MRGPCNQCCGRHDNLASPRGEAAPPGQAGAPSPSPSTPLLLKQKNPLKARRKQPEFVGRDTTLLKGGREERDLSGVR